MSNENIPDKQNGTFHDGYLDGWHSIKPETNPNIPGFALDGEDAGLSYYQIGYKRGKKAAEKDKKNS